MYTAVSGVMIVIAVGAGVVVIDVVVVCLVNVRYSCFVTTNRLNRGLTTSDGTPVQ